MQQQTTEHVLQWCPLLEHNRTCMWSGNTSIQRKTGMWPGYTSIQRKDRYVTRFYEYTEKGQVCDQVIRVYREKTGMWPGYTSIQRKDRYVARFYEYT